MSAESSSSNQLSDAILARITELSSCVILRNPASIISTAGVVEAVLANGRNKKLHYDEWRRAQDSIDLIKLQVTQVLELSALLRAIVPVIVQIPPESQ